MRSMIPVPLLIAALVGCATPSSPIATAGPSTVSTGAAQASDFSLRSTDGRTVRLSDYLGRDVIMLNFWATWCVPCLGEMPALEKLHQGYKDQGFTLIGISIDGPESVANVGPTLRRFGISYTNVLDEETSVVALYNPARDAPYTVLIDRNGRIAETKLGYAPGDEAKLEQSIKALLGPAPQAVTQ